MSIDRLVIYLYFISIYSLALAPFISFSLIDEIIVLILALCGMFSLEVYKRKEFLIVFIILFFYLLYSLINKINNVNAIIFDFIIFTKPFISFYIATKIILPVNKKIFHVLSIGVGVLTWLFLPFIDVIYSNTTAFYPLSLFAAVSYLLFSSNSSNNKNIALLFLIPGLFTARAKFYAEFLVFIYLFYFLGRKINFSLKNVFLLICTLFIIIYVNLDKISFYFITGYEEKLARTMLYYTSYNILIDYIPLGSGFGTFGTEAAARYYSPLYYDYGLNGVLGLRPDDYGTSYNYFGDTFYPILSQFGLIGVILFIIFWIKRWKEGSVISYKNNYLLFIFVYVTMAIQNIADNTFTGPYSIPIMMALGLLVSKRNNLYV